MPCLDTNFIIAVLRDDPQAVRKINSLETSRQLITTSSITIFELYKGIYRSTKPGKTADLEAFLKSVSVLDLDREATKTGARILQELQSSGQTIGEMDVLIAGAVIANNETLVTRDEHFKRIKELRIETW